MTMPDLPILHVDMDAFFAEVERLTDPSLIGRPVVVGGVGGRGVVASASYEARAMGVHSAMPIVQARRLCPSAAFVPPHFPRYSAASVKIREVFESFTPLVEPISLDEAFLDVSGAHGLFGSSARIAGKIRIAIAEATRLNCSVGVASTKTLAKLASTVAKPKATLHGTQPGAGVYVVPVKDQLRFLHALRVEVLWGVGKATMAHLERLGVVTVGDLAAVPVAALAEAVGRSHGAHLSQLASGIDDRPVEVGHTAKSMGHEETFDTDVADIAVMRTKIIQLSDAVAWRLRRAGLAGRNVQLKVKLADFTLHTRSKQLPAPEPATDMATRIAQIASDMLSQVDLGQVDLSQGVRLLGVSVTQLEPANTPTQLTLGFGIQRSGRGDQRSGRGDEQVLESERHLVAAVDDIRERFGGTAIGFGHGSGTANRSGNPRAAALN